MRFDYIVDVFFFDGVVVVLVPRGQQQGQQSPQVRTIPIHLEGEK